MTAAAAWASRRNRRRADPLLGQVGPEDFDGHDAVKARVVGLEHDAHAAPADDLEDLVLGQLAQVFWVLRRAQEVERDRGAACLTVGGGLLGLLFELLHHRLERAARAGLRARRLAGRFGEEIRSAGHAFELLAAGRTRFEMVVKLALLVVGKGTIQQFVPPRRIGTGLFVGHGDSPVVLHDCLVQCRVGTAHHNPLCIGGRCPPYCSISSIVFFSRARTRHLAA